MRNLTIKSALVLACWPWMAGLVADGVQVKISNETVQDLVVNVYDMNTQPQKMLLSNAHINGFTSVLVNAIGDATGRANLSWTATSTDSLSPKCGQDQAQGLANNAAVIVHADSNCGG
jgi:hypothetical protein